MLFMSGARNGQVLKVRDVHDGDTVYAFVLRGIVNAGRADGQVTTANHHKLGMANIVSLARRSHDSERDERPLLYARLNGIRMEHYQHLSFADWTPSF
jgi:hypothetical protein